MRCLPKNGIRVLEQAVKDGVRYMEAQEKSLAEIRNRSMQLLQVILVAESIAFSVVHAGNEEIAPWVVAMLLSALAASLGVTLRIPHPSRTGRSPGAMDLGKRHTRRAARWKDILHG